MTEYIVVWKSAQGQQVNTVVDAHNNPVLRDVGWLETQGIVLIKDDSSVLEKLSLADGEKFAISLPLARTTLGWDL